MNGLIIAGWFFWLIVSLYFIFCLVGYEPLVRIYKQNRGWPNLIVELTCLLHFAIVVLIHPFS